MTVTVNGEIHPLNRSMTIAELLQDLNLPREGIAVAVNASVIPRKDHAHTLLNEGDVIEIIRAVAGG